MKSLNPTQQKAALAGFILAAIFAIWLFIRERRRDRRYDEILEKIDQYKPAGQRINRSPRPERPPCHPQDPNC